MNVHAKPMEIGEVEKISRALLKQGFANYGFSEATVSEDKSFDGESIFRIDAAVKEKVPADVIVDTLDAIHSTLRSKGEERLVFLTTKLPQTEPSADAEEDVD